MIAPALAIALMVSPVSGSLKDPPERPTQITERWDHMPEPGRHPYVFVGKEKKRFYVPLPLMHRHGFLPEQVISPAEARTLARELGANYSDEELEKLETLDEKDTR